MAFIWREPCLICVYLGLSVLILCLKKKREQFGDFFSLNFLNLIKQKLGHVKNPKQLYPPYGCCLNVYEFLGFLHKILSEIS